MSKYARVTGTITQVNGGWVWVHNACGNAAYDLGNEISVGEDLYFSDICLKPVNGKRWSMGRGGKKRRCPACGGLMKTPRHWGYDWRPSPMVGT